MAQRRKGIKYMIMNKKESFILFILCFLFSTSSAQAPADRLNAIFKNSADGIPADQVFLHIDRNLYHPGDTIRFQGYIRDRQTGIFETKSLSLYVLLLDQARRTVDSARFRISNSTSPGWLKIPDTAPLNDYLLVAFTSNMMNFDPQYSFSAPFRIDKMRPVVNASDQKSEKEKAQPFQLQVSQETVNLSFLPEGGTYIYGIKQRLAFNAITSVGSQINADGEIVNQKGEKICGFKPGPLGPGIVEFTPEKGSTYFATLKGKEFSGMKWSLPVPENSGVALRVNSQETGIINIRVEGKGVEGMNWLLSLVMNDILVMSKEFRLDSAFRFRISTEELPAGTASVILFNSELKPVAERMIFVNSHNTMNIGVKTSADSYKRGEEGELILKTTDSEGRNLSSIVSVSVFDSISGYFDRFPFPDIKTTFLFEREFYDNLPAKLKLKGLSNLDEESIDLLLMTYGWKKFKMKEPSDTTVAREIKSYDYLKIKNPGPEKKTREEIKVVAIEGTESFSLKPDLNHEVVLPFDSLDSSVRQIMILPDRNKLRNLYPVNVEFSENKNFTDKAKQTTTESKYFETDISLQKKADTDFGLDSAIMIDPITIQGKKVQPVPYVNKYQEYYQWANTVTITKKEMTGCINFEDILVRLHPYIIDTRNKLIFIQPGRRSLTGKPPPALFVVDDIPLIDGLNSKSYMLIADMPASEIESVTMLKGDRGNTFYGYDANGGVVFVTTSSKQRMDGKYTVYQAPDRIKDDLIKPIRIFRSEIEFYIPNKEEVVTIPDYHFRPTVLWKNEVLIDESGTVKIKYPNNMVKGTIIVSVNGVSFTNMVGSNIFRYKIR
jgi:hypothetical protein